MSCSLRPVGRAHRARLEQLTRGTGLFREEEVATAVELLDESLAGHDDYQFVGAFEADRLVVVADRADGFADQQGSGIGTRLLREVESRLTAHGARLVVVETSSRADYAPTRGFYESRGYTRTATIPGYYAPGDDLVVFTKDLT